MDKYGRQKLEQRLMVKWHDIHDNINKYQTLYEQGKLIKSQYKNDGNPVKKMKKVDLEELATIPFINAPSEKEASRILETLSNSGLSALESQLNWFINDAHSYRTMREYTNEGSYKIGQYEFSTDQDGNIHVKRKPRQKGIIYDANYPRRINRR